MVSGSIFRNKYSIFLNLSIIILYLLTLSRCQVNVFPDKSQSNDSVFQTSPSTSFLYSAGYFTNSATNLFINRQGIVLTPLSMGTYCSPRSGNLVSNAADSLTRDALVNNPSPVSDLYDVYSNTIYTDSNTGLNCKFPLYTSGNTAYTYYLKVPVFNSSSNSGNLQVFTWDNTSNFNVDIFNTSYPAIAAGSLYNMVLTIQQNGVTGQVKVTSTGGTSNAVYLDTTVANSSFLWLSFQLNIGISDIRLSWFAITLNTGGSTTYTRNGSATCDSNNPCLEKYKCVGTTCKICHSSCLTCSLDASNASSNTACLSCNRHTSNWKTGPTSGTCAFQYIDLSQFQNISINTIEPPRTNRVTLSAWILIANLSNFQNSNNVFHFSVKNFLVMSLYGSSSSQVGLYCFAYEKLKPTIETLTSVTGVQTQYNSDTTTVINQVIPTVGQGGGSLDTKWFFVQCAMSFEHQQFFVNTSINGVDNYVFKSLPTEILFTSPNSVSNDVYFRTVYRSGEYLTLNINNIRNINSSLFVRNLNIFREFIPYQLHYMHFNIHNLVSSAADWPELLFTLPLDNLTYGGTYTSTSTSYTLPTAANSIAVSLIPVSTPNMYPPVTFKRLDLISTKNLQYTTGDLSNTGAISISASQYINFADDKALTCQSNYWLELTSYTCNVNCVNPSTMTMYPGVSSAKGYCNYPCTGSMNCPNTSGQLSNLKNNFTCISASNIYYNCLTVSIPNYYNLYFNSFYRPSNIYIDRTKLPAYKSYVIEIWYLPDNSMSNTNFVSSSAPSFANYVFYSNSMRVYYNSSTSLYYLELNYNTGNPTNINSIVNSYEWNKFIFNVYWDTSNYNMQFYVKNSISNPITITGSSSTTTDQSLQYILFCHLDVSNCNGNNVYWSSGIYRGLRIWNGDLAQPYSLTQYDIIYSSSASRPASIAFYYPMTLGYIGNNVLTDPGNTSNNYSVTNSWNQEFVLQTYNYSSKLDYIQATNSFTNYMSNISNRSVTISGCDSSCKRCFGSANTMCSECNTGYFLVESTCRSNASAKYFLASPSNNNVSITFNSFGANITPMGTITFWAKVIGFAGTTSDMIYYGTNFKLQYDGTNYGTNANYGLNLIYTPSTYVAREPLFRFNFGKWTFFSLAYYYDASTTNYFPQMIKFEINNTSYQILSTNITGISISQFTISNSLYGLVANIKAYSTYIIGAYGFETNQASPTSPFTRPVPFRTYLAPGSNASNCLNPASDTASFNDTYNCVVDYELSFETTSTCNNNTRFYSPSTKTCSAASCPSSCSTMCMSTSTNAANISTGCTCLISNSNSSMILKNNNSNICYKFDYINFAKVSPITLTNVQTARSSQKYTMQFWIYAYNYVNNRFGGVSFKWNYHNKIDIIFNSGSYQYKCSPLYDSSDTSYENSVSSALTFTINTWNFVSCAVDRTINTFYMNTASANYSAAFGVSTPPNLLTNSSTNLVISDNTVSYSDWGVLFFRQIRLWIDCYTSAGFLSRVNIKTTSLFPNLMNIWDPLYTGTNQLVDLQSIVAFNSPTVALSYTGVLGSNVVDENFYSTLFMCSENGQYYDTTLNTCVQFTDLSKINNFQFNSIAASYNGDYTIEFWIFFEDFNDITYGINLIWDKHVAVSILKTTSLSAMCFPQAYYDNISGTSGAAITTKFSSAINAYSFTLNTTSGNWLWIRCAVSNYNKNYYINTSGNQILKSEILFDNIRNDYPFRYYFYNGFPSTLKVENIVLHTKKIYIRNIHLFREYLPIQYDFRYMDLSNIGQNYFPSLVFACNFANFNFATNALSYSLYEYGFTSSINSKITLSIAPSSTFGLAANFVSLPLCNPSGNLKYDSTTNTCISITSCNNLNSWYCYDESSPLTCYANNYYNTGTPPSCVGQCPTGIIRSPGSVKNNAICNTACDANVQSCPNVSTGSLTSISSFFTCQSGFDRINYRCSPVANTANSAVFFSRCYNTPNIYVNLSNTTTSKLLSGHIFEFWFKIDSVYNNISICPMTTTNEYYIYAPPHSIYKDTTNNNYYYRIVNTVYVGQLPSIQKYEWNRIIIKTIISNGVQSVYVYVNYNLSTPDWSMTNIPSITNMQITNISFCSNSTNGNCLNSSPLSIEWGSAYYKNFRIWDVSSATEWLVQAYNNKLFQETLRSLILFYPLTLDKVDMNNFTNTVGNYDHLVYTINYTGTNRLYSTDQPTLINYSSTFDWGVSNSGKYITSMTGPTISSGSCSVQCKRCYSSSVTNCYECNPGFFLKGQTCTSITNYYFKIPVGVVATPVSLKITDGSNYDLTRQNSFTMTFWIKFFGVLSSASSSQPMILSLSSNTIFSFDIATKNLLFTQNSAVAFMDTSWNTYIGNWVLITFSNYISNSINTYYPNMMTLSVNNKDIPMQTSYSIPSSGITVTQVQLGYEVVAEFAEFRFYSKFYQGSYGLVTALATTKSSNLLFMIPLSGNSSVNCISDNNLASGTVTALSVTCVGDYNFYLDSSQQCNDDTKYLDQTIITSTPPCGSCAANCSTLCFGSIATQCTCDISLGYYWLRRTTLTKQAYCETVPYIDFSIYNPINFTNIKGSQTLEFTIEFWVFIYSYNNGVNQFKQIDISWDLHNKVSLLNQSNSLVANCYVLYDKSNSSRFSENINITLTYYKWNIIRCGTDLKNKQFFFNTVLNQMQTTDIPSQPGITSLNISMPATAISNFGFIFIRELKLWQQFNYNYIDTSYINLVPTYYPGLLHYFKNTYQSSITTMTDSVFSNISVTLSKRSDFIGYNFIDPNNSGLYSLLTLCDQGKVYNPTSLTCITPTSPTKCLYPGDMNDNCIACPTSNVNINVDGTCVSICPPLYFPNTKINQCRKCDDSCYKCTDIWATSCTACTGSLYYVSTQNRCVTNCETYGLTKSLTTANTCVVFDASATLVNVSTLVAINPTTFNSLTAQVVGATSSGYTTNWKFNFDVTQQVNNNSTKLQLNQNGPFTSDKTLLTVALNADFFQLGFKYNFGLDIIKSNNNSNVVVSKNWTLTMNQAPQNGRVLVTPNLGLTNTTTFILQCLDWIDDNSPNLNYRFFSIENNTNTVNIIANFSNINEVYTNFTVRYYQLPSTSVQIFCEVQDAMGALNSTSMIVTIVNSISSNLYNLTYALQSYKLPNNPTESQLLARSEYLKSLGIDPYKEVRPNLLRTEFWPSLDGSIVVYEDPKCTSSFCNGKGYCGLADVSIACICNMGYMGSNCHLDTNGFQKLNSEYFNLYNAINTNIGSSLTYNQLKSMWNIFFAGSTFTSDPILFSTYLNTFITLSLNSFIKTVTDNISMYFDLYDFYFSFIQTKLSQTLLQNKNTTSYPYRNITLALNQQQQFATLFADLTDGLDKLILNVIKSLGTTSKTIQYDSNNFYVAIVQLTPIFNELNFFSDRINNYRSWAKFMKCINYIQTSKLNNPYYVIWLTFIEYYAFPYSYDPSIYTNNTSPLIHMYFTDAQTGKAILVEGCDNSPINLFLPFSSYTWVDTLNEQRDLFRPDNYKSPDDPIFSSPIYISPNGTVSNDTIQDRIKKYHRKYNFSCQYFDTGLGAFWDDGVNFANLTDGYIIINTTHLTKYTTFFVPNVVSYQVEGRFFYLRHIAIFLNLDNYWGNLAWYIIFGLLCFYFISLVILTCDDMKYFRQETLLEFLKKEIIRVHTPYQQKLEIDLNDLMPPDVVKNNLDVLSPDNDKDNYDNFNDVLNLNKFNNLNNVGKSDEQDFKFGFDDDLDQGTNTNKPDLNINKIEIKKKKSIFDQDSKSIDLRSDRDNKKEDQNKETPYNDTFNVPSKDFNNFISNADKQNADGALKFTIDASGEAPDPFTEININDEEEYQLRLEAFANLNLTSCQFFCWNLKQRHVLLNPLINISVFHPRYKKLTLFMTECALIMWCLSVFLTLNPTTIINLSYKTPEITNLGNFIGICFVSVIVSNLILYLLAVFFRISAMERRRLFKIVTSGAQLLVLKEWEIMESINLTPTIIGMFINVCLWFISFYFTISFTSVWRDYVMTWVIGFGTAFFIDLILFEFLFEWFISFLYWRRRSSQFYLTFSEWLNRVRSYRTLWP